MATFLRLEKCLLPPPETIRWNEGNLSIETYSTTQKVAYCVKNLFTLVALLFVSPFTLAYDVLAQRDVAPLRRTPDIEPPEPVWPPEQRGFASSLFQTSGLGTKWSASPELAGTCDWDEWLNEPAHMLHPDGFDYKNFFTDVLSDPTVYIEMLIAQNVTAHRFSLEWSVIEPRPGEIDRVAVRLYQNFIHKLIEAGITPSITLSHFTVPDWFYRQGNFQKLENTDAYVNFGLTAMELFPEVKDWWSFNELGVKAFQQTREVYPTDLPKGSSLSSRVHAAGIATRNMLIAHCKLHQRVAERHPDKKVGVTHQWLKFDMATGNPLEKIFRYYFEKFGFYPVYGFFKEGRYAFEFPFMANIHFEIPQEAFDANGHFLMRLGVQAYPKPMVKMGFNRGQRPPCLPGSVQNSLLTFGSACESGGSIMRFGPRCRAEGMDEFLDEAFALTDQIYITEYGADSRMHQWGRPGFEFNDDAQADYLRQLTERIQNYSVRHRREIKGIFCWSDLRRQIEWENGHECKIATIDPILDENRRMVGWATTPASQYLAEAYGRRHQQADYLTGSS